MPTAFARLDARGNGVWSTAYAFALHRRLESALGPSSSLANDSRIRRKAARRDTRRRFSCFVVWPSAYWPSASL
jgi:hypothetical protein